MKTQAIIALSYLLVTGRRVRHRFCLAAAFLGFTTACKRTESTESIRVNPDHADAYSISVISAQPNAILAEAGSDDRSNFDGRRDVSPNLNGGIERQLE